MAERLGLEVESFEGLCEVDFGHLDGRRDQGAFGLVKEVLGAWAAAEHDTALPDGESWNDVARRLRPVLDPLIAAERAGAGEVAIVGHAGTFRILVDMLVGPEATNAVGFLRNTGLLVLRPGDGDRWTLEQPDPDDVTGPGSTDVRRIAPLPEGYGD